MKAFRVLKACGGRGGAAAADRTLDHCTVLESGAQGFSGLGFRGEGTERRSEQRHVHEAKPRAPKPETLNPKPHWEVPG